MSEIINECKTTLASTLNNFTDIDESSPAMESLSPSVFVNENDLFAANLYAAKRPELLKYSMSAENNQPVIDAFVMEHKENRLYINVNPFSVISCDASDERRGQHPDTKINYLIQTINLIPFNEINELVIDCGGNDSMAIFLNLTLPIFNAIERVKEFKGDDLKITVNVSPIADIMTHIYILLADKVVVTHPATMTGQFPEGVTVDQKIFIDEYAKLVKRLNIMSDEKYEQFISGEFVCINIDEVAKNDPRYVIID